MRFIARYRDPEGHQRGKAFPTKKAANEFLARVAVDVQRGEYVSPDNARRPLGPIAEEWIASLYHLKPKTLMNYENALRYHVLPRLGETPVGAIDQHRVRRFITDMLGDGVSPAQVRKAVGRLKQTLDLAVELGLIRKNPCVGVKLPPMPHEEMHFLTADQIATLAAGMPEPYDLMVRFRRLHRPARGRDRRAAPSSPTAGRCQRRRADRRVGGARRPGRARPQILQLPPRGQAAGLPRGAAARTPRRRGTGHARVPRAAGRSDAAQQLLQRIFKPTLRQTLPKHLHGVRFHDLRHSNAALLIAEGGHRKAIQQRLGHSSITVTLDRYGHLFPSLDDALADALDATYRTTLDARRSLSGPGDEDPPDDVVVDLWSAGGPRAGEATTKSLSPAETSSREPDSNRRPSLYKVWRPESGERERTPAEG
ncbi:MAG: tyrosine-type recombinase/integrase [Aldersonia sp.]|nr:tyrosine-type recombinase/integrase [Aldersonia sp.]